MPPEEIRPQSSPHATERDVWLTLPNALTVCRLLAIYPFANWIIEGRDQSALILFICAGLTDTLDGTIARRFGQTSRIGRLLDPLADKLFTGVAFVVLSVFRGSLRSIPHWVMASVILRDILILLGSFLVYRVSRNSEFRPSIFGKLNTFIEIGVVVVFLARAALPFLAFILPMAYCLLLVSVFISGADYLRSGIRMAKIPGSTGGSV